jgi:ParB-like chromosome segregation protein Spo0J
MAVKAKLKVVKYSVSKLCQMVDKDNPREVPMSPNNPVFKELESSMKQFGYVVPIIVNKCTNRIIAGHFRLAVLKENGVKEVDVVEVDLSPAKEKGLNIALNSIKGDWDIDKLQKVVNFLATQNVNFSGTGFTKDEIQVLLSSSEEKEKLKAALNNGTKTLAKVSWSCSIGKCQFKIEDSVYQEICKLVEKHVDLNKILELGCETNEA